MTSALLYEVAKVARHDSDAILDFYAYPPKVLTEEERREADRLLVLSHRIAYQGDVAAYEGR